MDEKIIQFNERKDTSNSIINVFYIMLLKKISNIGVYSCFSNPVIYFPKSHCENIILEKRMFLEIIKKWSSIYPDIFTAEE